MQHDNPNPAHQNHYLKSLERDFSHPLKLSITPLLDNLNSVAKCHDLECTSIVSDFMQANDMLAYLEPDHFVEPNSLYRTPFKDIGNSVQKNELMSTMKKSEYHKPKTSIQIHLNDTPINQPNIYV